MATEILHILFFPFEMISEAPAFKVPAELK